MEESTRVLDSPICRKASILAFHMITPYTDSITPAFIETQLQKADMFHEFQVAAQYMCDHWTYWHYSDWQTRVVNQPEVVQFLSQVINRKRCETRNDSLLNHQYEHINS
jgi:hypothetical protein